LTSGMGQEKEFVRLLLGWAQNNLREFPWRETEDPYEIFIAETLLKRTTSKAVNRLFEDFLQEFDSLDKILQASEGQLEEALKPVGLYKQRSKGLKEAATYINENFDSLFPTTYGGLIEIPHIGPYTAGAIASFAFDRPIPIVDSNVKRVTMRVFQNKLSEEPTNNEVKKLLQELIPQDKHRSFNLGLIDLGSLVCSYDKKVCSRCPVKQACHSIELG